MDFCDEEGITSETNSCSSWESFSFEPPPTRCGARSIQLVRERESEKQSNTSVYTLPVETESHFLPPMTLLQREGPASFCEAWQGIRFRLWPPT